MNVELLVFLRAMNIPYYTQQKKFSKNNHFEKYIDFASGFLVSRINSNDKKTWFMLSILYTL
jgi:hypothetical protein